MDGHAMSLLREAEHFENRTLSVCGLLSMASGAGVALLGAFAVTHHGGDLAGPGLFFAAVSLLGAAVFAWGAGVLVRGLIGRPE